MPTLEQHWVAIAAALAVHQVQRLMDVSDEAAR